MTETSVSQSLSAQHPSAKFQRLIRLLVVESLVSVSGSILTVGIFFYTHKTFGWGAQRNLLLCGMQGLIYIIGALAAHPISAHVKRRTLLGCLQAVMFPLALLPVFWTGQIVLVVTALLYVLLAAMQWPVLESLISSGAGAAEMSRRISIYNLVWSVTVAVSIGGCGPILAHWPAGLFAVTAVTHLLAGILLLRREDDPDSSSTAHLWPEPELIPLRTLAMRLSRVVMPASYAVTFSLIAMMPTLPAVMRFPLGVRPLIGSVWMIARCLSFVLLGAGVWWHTRPRAMLAAAVVLFAAFLGVTLTDNPGQIVLWQIAVGLAAGMIYSGSLYFGMVLSSGSTEHGGYHEALVGLGSIVGPGAGALAEFLQPGKPNASVMAVAVVLSISLLGAACVSMMTARRDKSRA